MHPSKLLYYHAYFADISFLACIISMRDGWRTLLGCYTKNGNAFITIHLVNILIHVSISRTSVGLLRPGNDRWWSLFYSCLSSGYFFANLPSQAPAATNSHPRSSLLSTKAKSINWYVYRVTQTSNNGNMMPLEKEVLRRLAISDDDFILIN